MLPYLRQQLAVGEFVRDGSVPAMRATLYGLESGTVDLLITDKETYRLEGPHDAPNACTALGHKYNPPGDSWLSPKSACDGEAPVGTKNTQWWKTAGPDGRAVWQWYRTDNRLPWRIMFPTRNAEPAVIGDYLLDLFHIVRAGQGNQSRRLARPLRRQGAEARRGGRCRHYRARIDGGRQGHRRVRTGNAHCIAHSRRKPASMFAGDDDELAEPVRHDRRADPDSVPVHPLPSMIYYDWDEAGTMVGMMNSPHPCRRRSNLKSVQTKGVGYGIERRPNSAFACRAATPGVVRPNWMISAGCTCSAVIDHNPELGPDETSVIRACPSKVRACT